MAKTVNNRPVSEKVYLKDVLIDDFEFVGGLPSGGVINKFDINLSIYYLGSADSGTLVTDSTWNITRIEILNDGTSINATSIGAWNDRYVLIYN